MDVIVPDLEAAALDHEDHDLVVAVIEMIVTAAVIVAVGVGVVDRDREAVIVAGGGRGVDLVLMSVRGVEVQGRDLIAAVEVMIVATEEETEIDAIGVIFVTETDMVDHHHMVAAAVDHEVTMMTDMAPLHPDSLADHLDLVDSHLMASQAISHHPTQEIEGVDVPPDVMMVLQV